MKNWFRFENAADGTAADVFLVDFIGDWIDDIFGVGVTAKSFISELEKLPASVKKLRVHINSPGGDVFGALNIANALRDQRNSKGRKVEVYVDGLAASAATLVMMAGDPIVLADNALVMVHNPWTVATGDADELRKQAGILDQLRDTIVATYQWHVDLSDEELVAMMANETWLDANEARDYGFADEVIEGIRAAATFDPKRLDAYKIPDRYRSRVTALFGFVPGSGTPVPEPVPEPEPEPAARPITAEGALALSIAAGIDDASFVASLAASELTYDRAVLAVEAEKDHRNREAERVRTISALCEKFRHGNLAPDLIAGGMATGHARSLIAKLTAMLDKVELDSTLGPDPEGAKSRGSRPRVAEVYAGRR